MATITINIDPMFNVGPLMLTWHGLMIAVGIVAGGWLAMRYAEELELSRDTAFNLIALLALAGIVGSRLLYLILGPMAVAVYQWRARLSLRYLDALAAGFPLGMAVGRIGDVISGEHYGSPTTLPWGFRYLNPMAEVPNTHVAYHQGGFYEIVLALAMLAVWPWRCWPSSGPCATASADRPPCSGRRSPHTAQAAS